MVVKFIKGNRHGEVIEASDKRAAYWQRMGLVEEVIEQKETKEVKPKKTAKKKK
jgi:hypothetical protein